MELNEDVCRNFIHKLFKNGNLWSFVPVKSNRKGFKYYASIHWNEKFSSGIKPDDELGVLLPITEKVVKYMVDNDLVVRVDISDLKTDYGDSVLVKGLLSYTSQTPTFQFNTEDDILGSKTDISEFEDLLK